MAKTSIRLLTLMIPIASLATLAIISSCATSTSSSPGGAKMQVVRQVFPSAIDIAEVSMSQDAQEFGRPAEAKISEIRGASGLLGYCVESKVVSRSGPFRIRVLLDSHLYVKQAKVISYPWDRGRDVRKRAFTSQFEGKGPEDPIQLGKDIDAMTGATISSRVMAEGVRDTIKLLKLVKEQRPEKQTGESTSASQQRQHTDEQSEQQTNEPKIVKTIQNKEMKGAAVLYRKNCSACHGLIEPGRFEREKWNRYIDKYGRALTLEEKQILLHFLDTSGQTVRISVTE